MSQLQEEVQDRIRHIVMHPETDKEKLARQRIKPRRSSEINNSKISVRLNKPSQSYIENHTIRQLNHNANKARIDELAYKKSFFNSIRWDILKNIKVQKQIEMGQEIEARNRKSNWAVFMRALCIIQTLNSKMVKRKA